MKLSEAIKIIKGLIASVELAYKSSPLTDKEAHPAIDALNLAISALEKQIPRPVRIEYDRRHNYFLHFCPVCGDLAREYKYCSDCGQKLSYEEKAEEEDE